MAGLRLHAANQSRAAYCFIASGEGGHRDGPWHTGPCTLHNPSYDFNDALIPLGATYWVRLAQAWLNRAPVNL